jgi:hypothetical protein
MANLKNLQQAASVAAGKTRPPKAPPPSPARPAPAPGTPAAPAAVPASASTPKNSRAGKIALTFHLPEDFKRSLRLVQAHRGNGFTLELLAAEALNDLFVKYNVPTVHVGTMGDMA